VGEFGCNAILALLEPFCCLGAKSQQAIHASLLWAVATDSLEILIAIPYEIKGIIKNWHHQAIYPNH
jgi:hypothetical protein